MSIVFGLIMALTVSVLGFKFANKYYLQKRFFDNFINFLSYLQSNLSFQSDNLLEVFTKYKHNNNDFGDLIGKLVNARQQNVVFDIHNELNKFPYLSNCDTTQIADFLCSFGTVDKETQLEQINATISWAKQRQTFFNTECIQKGKMYRTLSVMLGLVILVIYI